MSKKKKQNTSFTMKQTFDWVNIENLVKYMELWSIGLIRVRWFKEC